MPFGRKKRSGYWVVALLVVLSVSPEGYCGKTELRVTPVSPADQHGKNRESCRGQDQRFTEREPWGGYELVHFTKLINKLSKNRHQHHELADVASELSTKRRIGKISGVQLALIANGVSKLTKPAYEHAKRSLLEQLARAACRADAADRGQWVVKDLALMANAFAGVEGDIFTRALQILAHEVLQRGPRLEERDGWKIQSLAMISTAFGKVVQEQHVAETLSLVAREVINRFEGNGKQWSLQHMAMVANGLSKVVEGDAVKDTDAALRAIAGEVVDRLQGNGKQWSLQDMAMVANGLSKVVAGDAVKDTGAALKAIAGEVVNRLQGRKVMGWTVQHVGMIANALRRVDGWRVQKALNLLAGVATESLRRDVGCWSVPHLRMVANAIEKAEGRCVSDALRTMAGLITEPGSALSINGNWSSHDLSMMANAIIKTDGIRVQRALKAIAREVVKRRHNTNSALRTWPAYHLARVANAISRMPQDRDAIEAVQALADVVIDQSVALRDAQRWPTSNPALMGSAIRTFEGERIQRALSTIAEAVIYRRHDLGSACQWSGNELGNIAHAISYCEGAEAAQALEEIARAILRRGEELKQSQLWSHQHLSMAARAISKIADHGDAVNALTLIAAAVIDQQRQADKEPCSAVGLVMMANAFGRVNSDCKVITGALVWLAEEFTRPQHDLGDRREWSALNLSLVANAFGKIGGEAAADALIRIAMEITNREPELYSQETWPVRYLALVANAIGKVQGKQATYAALNVIARVAAQQGEALKDEHFWCENDLAMLAYGLSRAPGEQAVKALNIITDAVLHRGAGLNREQGGSAKSLAMLASGLYLDTSAEALNLVVDLALERAAEDPASLVWLLRSMSRWHLLGSHLQVAVKLFQALEDTHFQTDNRQALEELLWAATVLYFGSAQQPSLAHCFEQQYLRYRARLPDSKVPDADQQGYRGVAYDSRWHGIFAQDYWDKNPSAPVIETSPLYQAGGPPPSQHALYRALSTAFHQHTTVMEARINKFPVDILLAGKICIEVDGPSHFVSCNSCRLPSGQSCTRTKDRLLSYMLERYGFKVFRISSTEVEDREAQQRLIESIKASAVLE